MSCLIDHLFSILCHAHHGLCVVSNLVTGTPTPTPATQAKQVVQTLSWDEFHANDRNPIYLKIDGKSFQAQAMFAKTALRLQRRGVEKFRSPCPL